MSEKMANPGIALNPVEFRFGKPLPPIPERGMADPQNLWHTIDMNQLWIEKGVLDLGSANPYREPKRADLATHKIDIANTRRVEGGKYTDRRGIGAFSEFLYVSEADVVADFKGKNVLEIGSGAGVLSDELRREAGSHVTELDFSSEVLRSLPPVFEDRGSRVIADGTKLPFGDATFESTVSMYSTSVHTDRVRDRLTSLTEMFRVTKEGGTAFVVPLFAGLAMRQSRWFLMQTDPEFRQALRHELHLKSYENTLRQEAAMDYSVTDLLRTLIVNGNVTFTPILVQQEIKDQVYDGVSGIFQINHAQPKHETKLLIDKLVKKFS